MIRVLLSISIVATFWKLCQTSSGWSYHGDTGPSHWAANYKECGKQFQSPIDIRDRDVFVNDSLGKFTLKGHDTSAHPLNLKLDNNGHTVAVHVDGVPMELSGGGLPASYILKQFHFHWGSDDTKGSEHTVSGKAYPLELHMVHFNTKHGNISAAAHATEGLAVLGFFFEVSDSHNAVWDKVVKYLTAVQHQGKTKTLDPFSIRSLLPIDISNYYRYSGSLTTPSCDQSVIWTVFKDTIKISKPQMKQFRSVYANKAGDSHSEQLLDNFRPVQPLNGRIIFYSAAICITYHTTLLLSSLALVLFVKYVH